eukprot:9400074-Alexandrium_andersonii.AAC.1
MGAPFRQTLLGALSARGYVAAADDSDADLRRVLVGVLAGLGPPEEVSERRALCGALLALETLPLGTESVSQLRVMLAEVQSPHRVATPQ